MELAEAEWEDSVDLAKKVSCLKFQMLFIQYHLYNCLYLYYGYKLSAEKRQKT